MRIKGILAGLLAVVVPLLAGCPSSATQVKTSSINLASAVPGIELQLVTCGGGQPGFVFTKGPNDGHGNVDRSDPSKVTSIQFCGQQLPPQYRLDPVRFAAGIRSPCPGQVGGVWIKVVVTENGMQKVVGKSYTCDGEQGPAGPQGAAGTMVVFSVTNNIIHNGHTCSRIDLGYDDNPTNGKLDPAEISRTTYVCDGVDGVNGISYVAAVTPIACSGGGNGLLYSVGPPDPNDPSKPDPNSPDTTSTRLCAPKLPPLEHVVPVRFDGGPHSPCGPTTGGIWMEVVKDGSPMYVTRSYICDSKVPGPAGPPGPPGQNAEQVVFDLVSNVLHQGHNCTRFDLGHDTNGNGTLDPQEIQSTAYVCDGVDGVNGISYVATVTQIMCSNGRDGLRYTTGPPDSSGKPDPNSPYTTTAKICAPVLPPLEHLVFVRFPPGPYSPCGPTTGGLYVEAVEVKNGSTVIVSQSYVCDGEQGPPGPPGQNGMSIAFTLTTNVFGCSVFTVWYDLNDNQKLDPGEIPHTVVICGGVLPQSAQLVLAQTGVNLSVSPSDQFKQVPLTNTKTLDGAYLVLVVNYNTVGCTATTGMYLSGVNVGYNMPDNDPLRNTGTTAFKFLVGSGPGTAYIDPGNILKFTWQGDAVCGVPNTKATLQAFQVWGYVPKPLSP